MTEIVSLEALAELVRPGQSIAIPVEGVSMAATAALIETGATDLHLVCVPISGMQADMLIGAGMVGTLETSAVSLGEAGGAPRFGDRRPRRRVQHDGCDLPRDPCRPARRARKACRSCRSAASSAAIC